MNKRTPLIILTIMLYGCEYLLEGEKSDYIVKTKNKFWYRLLMNSLKSYDSHYSVGLNGFIEFDFDFKEDFLNYIK